MKEHVGSTPSRTPQATQPREARHNADELIAPQQLTPRNIQNPSCNISSPDGSCSSCKWRKRIVLTPVQAAELLGCDDKTITRWAREGYIPAHPMGWGKKKYWRFFEDELIAWLMDQNNGAWAA